MGSKVVDAGRGELEPAKICLEMEGRVIGEEGRRQWRVASERGQLAHPREVSPALSVEQVVQGLAEQDRENDLHVQVRLEMRFGPKRLAQPRSNRLAARWRDGVALSIGSFDPFDAVDGDTAVSLEPGERCVHLTERQGPLRRKDAIERLLQLVAVPRLGIKQSEKAVLGGHGATIH